MRCIVMAAVAAALLGGCSAVPNELGERPPEETVPSVREAAASPDRYRGDLVFWGGEIADVINQSERTLVEVIARPLDDAGAPMTRQPSGGRFLASFDGFRDPADFEEGKRLTVVGRLDGVLPRPIGEYRYPYPLVDVERQYLWPPERIVRPPPPPFWYDPFWSPWRYPYPYDYFRYRGWY
jgi:outer membrane lipoprotein